MKSVNTVSFDLPWPLKLKLLMRWYAHFTHTYVCVSRGWNSFFGRFCVLTKWMILKTVNRTTKIMNKYLLSEQKFILFYWSKTVFTSISSTLKLLSFISNTFKSYSTLENSIYTLINVSFYWHWLFFIIWRDLVGF